MEAFAAVKLLWQRADRVTVDVAGYRSATRSDGTSPPDLLAQTSATNELDVHVDARPTGDGFAIIARGHLRG